MVRLSAHPNSDETLMDRFFANPASNQLLSRDVPRINQVFEERYWVKMAKEGIAGHDNVSRIENCPPETLAWAFSEFSGDSGDKSRFLTHKNFPWRGSDVRELCKGSAPDDMPHIRAARFLFGKASQQEIAAEIEAGGSREVLFAPNLSANQLNKLVAQRPELAVLAAIHPNAEAIQVPAEHQKLVEMIRPQMHPIVLGGRSQTNASNSRAAPLEI